MWSFMQLREHPSFTRIAGMMDGKTSVFTVQLPAVAEVVPWDGKEGQAMEEEVRVGGTLT